MKVLFLNGSPREGGACALAISEMAGVFRTHDVECEIFPLGALSVRGCIACGGCKTRGACVIDDCVNTVAEKFRVSDALVVVTPVFYAGVNGTVTSALDRLFHSTPYDKRMKIGCSVACARRAGTVSTCDEVNRYFAVSGMPIATGQYWNGLLGGNAGAAGADAEGLRNLRALAENTVFLMRAVAAERARAGLPRDV